MGKGLLQEAFSESLQVSKVWQIFVRSEIGEEFGERRYAINKIVRLFRLSARFPSGPFSRGCLIDSAGRDKVDGKLTGTI